MKVLQDVWILHNSGIVVFHRVFNKSVSPQLFGAMMSALNTFSEQLTEGGLSNFEINKQRFTIIKKRKIIFVANSSKLINQKKVNRELEKVSKKFLKFYGKDLETYQGKIGAYSDFVNEIQDSLEETS
ncbi:MAG: hypothetical protein ACXABO_10500 [Promethearchaeota archaeon]